MITGQNQICSSPFGADKNPGLGREPGYSADVAKESPSKEFLAGVIEGFYGPPWTRSERLELFGWMSGRKLNTYLYAPKDDLKHRILWREAYSATEAEALKELISACKGHGLRFIYALSPGLDIRFSQETELACLQNRFEQMISLGCEHFALLFDDIPDQMHPEDRERWGSFALAQCALTNLMFEWTQKRSASARFLFCPTAYCERMAQRHFGGANYLETVGQELSQEIEVFWTGPEIISREISVPHIQKLQKLLHRKPLIWDNLHANDYDGRRFHCGPYSGRPLELRQEVAGMLLNPNNEFLLNFAPLHSLGRFIHAGGSWNARQVHLEAMAEWFQRFKTCGGPEVSLDDLILLGDCYYLPHEEGQHAKELLELAQSFFNAKSRPSPHEVATFQRQATRLRDTCARMAMLHDRPLFHALSRRIWELREEMDLWLNCIRLHEANPHAPWQSDFHLPGTYRGGIAARCQRLLEMNADGTFTPHSSQEATNSNPASDHKP